MSHSKSESSLSREHGNADDLEEVWIIQAWLRAKGKRGTTHRRRQGKRPVEEDRHYSQLRDQTLARRGKRRDLRK